MWPYQIDSEKYLLMIVKYIANSAFKAKGTAVRAITMDDLMEENQIESVGLRHYFLQ